MDITEIAVIMLLLGLLLGLFIAYLQSRVDKDFWSKVKAACVITGGISFLLFMYSASFIWYYIAVIFFTIIMYEPHEGNSPTRLREGFTSHRFRNPYFRREERPQLEEWL